jgi:hypothetical protein
VRANRIYRLIVTRGSREPAFLAEPSRHDRIEVVSIDDGEPILYWDLPVKEASRLVRELKADLAGMDAEEFIALWEGADAG